MLKIALANGLLAATFALAPASAQTMSCTDAGMMKTQANIDKMTDDEEGHCHEGNGDGERQHD